MSPAEEKAAFERLIDFIIERRAHDPGMHVYHYAPYEPTAMKRLMGRYATQADELDDLLRAEVFVDLYRIVRMALRAGVDSYSIKRLEPFYGLVREVDLQRASRHLRAVEYAIAKKDSASLSQDIRDAVRAYNRDDCISALGLRDWLERLRAEEEARRGEPLPRPAPPELKSSERLDDRLSRIRAVSEALMAPLPMQRNRVQQAQWVLGQLLEWHRREDKVDWWEFFRLNDMAEDELLDERAGLAGLKFETRLETTKRGVVVDRYHFPPQDTDFEEHDEGFEPGSEKPSAVAKVEAIDLEHRTIDLRKGAARANHHPKALFKHDRVSNPDAVSALLRLAEFVRDHGLDGSGPFRAARDLLLRLNPRLIPGNALRLPGESTVASARRVAVALDRGVLAIQGPPGAGKTFTGARMVVDLVRAGKKVGVTAVSHKVIRNLLDEVVRAAGEENVHVRCMHRVSEKSKNPITGIEEETDAGKAVAKILTREYDVVGGTAWVWAKEDVAEAVDVLFVDEAGQMSLANVLACAQAARNLVLLGDPQQLEQPQKAAHPEGSELSALEHLLEGHETIARGARPVPRRDLAASPGHLRFTSELFYERQARVTRELRRTRARRPDAFAGSGLFYVPVRARRQPEQLAGGSGAIAEHREELTRAACTWTDRHGRARPVTLDDILIVAPYNAQVSAIARAPSGRARRDRRQVPGPGGAGRYLLDGDVEPRGCAARHGVPLQPEPAERRDVASTMRVHPRRQPAAVRAGVPDAGADAAGERVLPLSGARAARRPAAELAHELVRFDRSPPE